jgi:hypothetical protein
MKLFISSVVFVLTILTGTTSFAQSPLSAESRRHTALSRSDCILKWRQQGESLSETICQRLF